MPGARCQVANGRCQVSGDLVVGGEGVVASEGDGGGGGLHVEAALTWTRTTSKNIGKKPLVVIVHIEASKVCFQKSKTRVTCFRGGTGGVGPALLQGVPE